jgi:hypothetical protein
MSNGSSVPTTRSLVLVTNLSRTNSANCSAVKPCARMTASVQPASPRPASRVGDLVADADEIAGALAETAELWNTADGLQWLRDGQLVSIIGPTLREAAKKHLATKRLVVDGANARVEYVAIELDEAMVRTILQGDKTRHRAQGRSIDRAGPEGRPRRCIAPCGVSSTACWPERPNGRF